MAFFPASNQTPVVANPLVTSQPMRWRYPRRYEWAFGRSFEAQGVTFSAVRPQ